MNLPYGLPAECLACHTRSDEFFCALSRKSRKAFNQIKHASVFPEGAIIFVEGQTPRGIFVLCQGQAKLSASSRDGKTFIVRIARAGEILGLDAVVAGRPCQLTAETMQPSQLSFVIREDFLRFLKEYSDASLRAAQHISRDCQYAYEVVRSIALSHSASERVARFLFVSATDGHVRDGVVHARLALTHEEIGQLIGVSRETITRTLAEFRKKDMIDIKGSNLTIHNKPALERLVGA